MRPTTQARARQDARRTPPPMGGAGANGDASLDGGTDARGDARGNGDTGAMAGSVCPSGGGPIMRRVESASSVPFCIDTTEVTERQYDAFLGNFALGSQEGRCSANLSFTPGGAFTPASTPDLPVTFVDFCDAVAFCTWSGKYLCGKVSTDGGDARGFLDGVDDFQSTFSNPDVDQWYAACAGPDGLAYPYGSAYLPGTCDTDTTDGMPSPLADAGSYPGCSTEAGVVDLSGSVYEWVDRCVPVDAASGGPPYRLCNGRGGTFAQEGDLTSCSGNADFVFGPSPVQQEDDLGFRCCADLSPP